MKHGFKVVLAGLALSAYLVGCGSSGGGSNSATTPGTGLTCSNGICAAGTGNLGYIGQNSWFGVLTTGAIGSTTYSNFLTFMNEAGGCSQYQCANIDSFFKLKISLTDGTVPGGARFALQTSKYGQRFRTLRASAAAMVNSANNGMLLNYNVLGNGVQNQYIPFPYNSNQPYLNQTNQVLQIVTTFPATNNFSTMTVNVYYRGLNIATGTMNLTYSTTNTQYQQQPYVQPQQRVTPPNVIENDGYDQPGFK